MADIFNRLIASRFAELARRMMGEDLELSTVAPEISLELALESDRPEWGFLKAETRWATQSVNVAAVAAQFGFLQVFNPAGSRRLVTVTTYMFTAGVARRFNQALTTTIRGASQNIAIPLDTRWNDPITPAAALLAREPVTISTGSFVAAGTDLNVGQDDVPAGVFTLLRVPLVTLAPGSGVLIVDSVVNEAFTGWIAGYSRIAKPEELS
jgi:hypothetical protein